VFSFVIFSSYVLGGPGGGHKGSLHCAALRGRRPGNGLYPRHDLDRSHTSNDKTKKKKKKSEAAPCKLLFALRPGLTQKL